MGHINEGQYTDCNLASVNAGIMHANLCTLTPENIRERFEDEERQERFDNYNAFHEIAYTVYLKYGHVSLSREFLIRNVLVFTDKVARF